jgi:two-component system, NtrC family, response regulator AtoC
MISNEGDKIQMLVSIVEALSTIPDETDLIQKLIFSAVEFTGAERGYLVRLNRENDLLFHDSSGNQINDPQVSVSVIRNVLNTNKPVCLIEDEEGHSIPPTTSIVALDLKSIMAAPMSLNTGSVSKDTGPDVNAVLYVDSRVVSKPFDGRDLDLFTVLAQHSAAVWKNKLLVDRLEDDFKLLHAEVQSKFDYHKIIGKCDAMKKVYEILEVLRPTDLDVMITGDTGTGKELIAKALHYSSSRSHKPFRQINCAALPESLVEAELFGVEKDVATEVKSRRGMIESAHEGTLFLDEIADMSTRVQSRILHFLETRRFRKIGGRDEIRADVRVLAATNRDINDAVTRGEFRDALRYRLEVVPIHLPPLRERNDDLRLLADHFLAEALKSNGLDIKGFSNEAWNTMQQYTWPGNIRELKHRIQSAAILARGNLIQPQDLGIRLPPDAAYVKPLSEMRQAFETTTIVHTLERCENSIKCAAEKLKVNPDSLKKKIREYNININV